MAVMRRHTRATAITVLILIALTSGCATFGLVESPASLLEQGKALYEARRYDEALGKFLEVIRREPTMWVAFLYAARAYIAKADWLAAIQHGRRALELAPTGQDVAPVFAEALIGGARDSLARQQYGEAISRLVEYVRLKPGDVSGWLDLGKAYWQSGQRTEAFAAFRRVLELQPRQEEALRYLLGTPGR
jgi:tetratricopeptide (TPR) repeat protein